MIARPWTEDLKKCQNTCVASYFSRLGRNSNTEDDYLCFYIQTDENTCLYGVFEPHNGLNAARFIMQQMAYELCFPPPSPESTDEDIREQLRNAFLSVEKAYIKGQCGDAVIAERASCQYELQALNGAQMTHERHEILSRLKAIDQHLSEGATVAIALVLYNKLFVANVGETRALLCKTDDNSVLRVVQLTVDHSLTNEDELLRISQLGLDVDKLRNVQYLGNQAGTRCLGNYLVKGMHRAFPSLARATAPPVDHQPEIHGPIVLDESCRFLVLVSSGVYKRIQEMRGNSEQTNKQLAQIIVEHFRSQPEFTEVSLSVLEEIEQEFNGYCTKNKLTPKPSTHMSLLIRNFNFPVQDNRKNTLSQSKMVPKNQSVRFNPIVQSKSNTEVNEYDSNASSYTNRSVSSSSSRQSDSKDSRIKPYVDFSCYYENVEKARKNGTLPSFIK